jgi:hypothetical protein
MSIEDQPTQQLRRTSEPASDGSTDVLSLDNLFERQTAAAAPGKPTVPAAEPEAATQPIAPAEPPPAPVERRVGERRAADRRVGVIPVTASAPTKPQAAIGQRLRGDTATAVRGGTTRARDWFITGDNALIIATALVAAMLILVVALV